MPQSDIDKTKILSKNLFPVVGVGASAGGLEAFKRLIRAIPENSGMAYILVQHLHPSHESALPEILQKETRLHVIEISDNITVAPNNIYIIPANKLMVATDGVLKLEPRLPDNKRNMAIDLFFSSLAEVHQAHAIGVILSGTGTDGTLGLKSIKDHGGLTFAQDPGSATYDAMPASAIAAEVADFILLPEKIPQQLLLAERTLNSEQPDKATADQLKEDELYKQILSVIRTRRGVDFTYYKQTTIRRRILRRMVIQKLKKTSEYLKYLIANKTEQDKLYQDLLIPVTEFFRDPKTFNLLCDKVLPLLLKDKSQNDPLRVWVAACSTGEEAYSIGICLHEILGEKAAQLKIQIFATDISEIAIAKARAGIYSKQEFKTVSDTRLQRYFTKIDGSYQVNKAIREMCVFAVHNFLKDPPFARMDLISCRNVLIYMEPYLQKKAFRTFHYALKDKGFLLLGKSETTGKSSELFSTFAIHDKIFGKKQVSGRHIPTTTQKDNAFKNRKDELLRKPQIKVEDFQKNADDILLSKYTPAGVIVDDHFDIVQFRGFTGDFLEPSPGKASLNVLKMARSGLAFELRNALHKARSTNEAFIKVDVPLGDGVHIDIEVIPLLNTIEVHFLILFSKHPAAVKAAKRKSLNKSRTSIEQENDKDLRIKQLEKELMRAREDMNSVSEDQEAINEELQSANEELLSGSEELQSLNEELETGKEEIQSTNEELMILNQELHESNNQLNTARHYAEAIVKTLREPLIILDQQLRIKSANNAFYEKFRLTENETEGKLLYELGNYQWDIPPLRIMLQQLMKTETSIENFEIMSQFPFIGERTVLLNARQVINEKNIVHLILLAIEDVTEKRLLEKKVKEHADELELKAKELQTILEKLPQITWTATQEGKFTFFNKWFLDYSGLTFEEATSFGWDAILPSELLPEKNERWEHSIKTGDDLEVEIPLKRKSDNMYRWHLSRASAIRDEKGSIILWVGAATDVHDQKLFSEELERQVQARTQSLKETNIELEHSNKNIEQFAFIASHDLQEPLRKIQTFAMLLNQRHTKDIPEEAKEFILKIRDAAARMSLLIQDVLNFSRISHSENQFVKIDLDKILDNVLKDFDLLISEKNAIIKRDELSTVEGIPLQINQLFYNLLSNALKFSKKDVPPQITISSRLLLKNEIVKYPDLNLDLPYCEISFKDNGIGFEQEYAEQIFWIFQRLNTKQQYAGNGIGLALCQKIVINHHGIIRAESLENEETVFYIILPVRQLVLNIDT